MHRLLFDDRASSGPIPTDRQFCRDYRNRAVMSTCMEVVSQLKTHYGIISPAELACTLNNRLENRFDVGRRRCNYAENVCAPRLIGQGIGKVASLCLHLVKQADVLGRDGGLIGESRG